MLVADLELLGCRPCRLDLVVGGSVLPVRRRGKGMTRHQICVMMSASKGPTSK
jgi:hypothetical protein